MRLQRRFYSINSVGLFSLVGSKGLFSHGRFVPWATDMGARGTGVERHTKVAAPPERSTVVTMVWS